ncbi:hypothetical protein FB45DRAFT_182892 [Roridomyces roridus]|uniref:AAA-ATPase-like domain-containing protein n=1 Tax=Roridomyces roridus TaxID=1738132 RepID=A0AAD7CEC2_9AGAR|nr:hypothetical protein FB45DRAFT_182892 [Roridomyces roridus]
MLIGIVDAGEHFELTFYDNKTNSPEVSASSLPSPSTTSSSFKRRSGDYDPSNDGEHRVKRVKRNPGSSNHMNVPSARDDFLAFFTRPQTAFVNKSRALFQLPKQFRYLLLRPPRFGKSAFLSAMSQFHDVHGAGTFQQYFGSQDAANDFPDSGHSQHLSLVFAFWSVHTRTDVEDFVHQLKSHIFSSLRSFLKKYARDLELPNPHTYLTRGEEEPLKRVFDLVKSRKKTLFVGVDSYDTSILEAMFSHVVYPQLYQTFMAPDEVARLFGHHFWRPLQAGSEIIAKLLVTGTLSLQVPGLQDWVAPAPNDLDSCCGFTADEALKFTQSIIPGGTVDVIELQRQCGDYLFSSDDEQSLLHPQILIDHVSKSTSEPSVGHRFRLLSSLFDLLQSESEDRTMVTVKGLVDLIATGVVEIDPSELDAGHDFDGTFVSWSALYHAGALAHVRGSKSTFRVAHSKVLSMIHSRIDELVEERYRNVSAGNEQINFLLALSQYDRHDHRPLMHALSQVLRDHAQPFLRNAKEPELSLLGILELVMRNHHLIACTSSQLLEPILSDPTGGNHVRVYGYSTKRIHHWEVKKALTLRGIWQAVNPNDTEPSVEALIQLHEELCQDAEEKVLARPYAVWSDSLQRMETRLVGSFFEPEGLHAQVIAVGGAQVLLKAGSAELIIVS